MKFESRKKRGNIMNAVTRRKLCLITACLGLMILATDRVSSMQAPLPNPVLVFIGTEFYETGGKEWTRYKYTVANLKQYPNELFAPAPALPPCGKNTKASRTWIDFYDSRGKRLSGFCALGSHDDLNGIYFSLERDVVPPSYVYIEMTDRQTNTKYKSNLAESTL